MVEQRRDRRRRHLPADEGVDARHDEDVVHQRDQHRHGELPLEAQRDVDRDDHQRGDDRDQTPSWRRSGRSSGRSTRRSGCRLKPNLSLSALLTSLDVRRRRAPRSRSGRRCLPRSGLLSVWIFASAEAQRRERVADLRRRVAACCSGAVMRVPPLEVDAEVDAVAGDRQRADRAGSARHGEEPLRLAHVVEAELVLAARRRRAPPCGCGSGACRAASSRIACVASTAVNSDTMTPRPRVNAKPLTPAVARMKRMNATRNVTMFASMIAVRPFCSPRRWPAETDLPGAHLLLDALEDDDVRVRRDAEREDQARDARQRQRDRDELDERVEVERVDAQRDRGDHAEHAVEDDQEERDDDEAGDARLEALVERLLAERGGDLRARDQLEPQRQRADLEDLRQVLRRL